MRKKTIEKADLRVALERSDLTFVNMHRTGQLKGGCVLGIFNKDEVLKLFLTAFIAALEYSCFKNCHKFPIYMFWL